MAMHVLKYRMKYLLRDRETVFDHGVPTSLAPCLICLVGYLIGDTVSFEL